jgi:hypothetical protein
MSCENTGNKIKYLRDGAAMRPGIKVVRVVLFLKNHSYYLPLPP